MLPCRGGEGFLHEIFEPLGYEVEAVRYPLDERFPEWGESPYYSVRLSKTTTLSELLTHLYVLIPVFDNFKHYWVGQDELEKLLKHGEGWLASHPKKEAIARPLPEAPAQPGSPGAGEARRAGRSNRPWNPMKPATESQEDVLERPISLNDQRLGTVVAALRASGAKRVLDLGCGEGKLLRELLKEKQFDQIVGMDVSVRSLEIAKERLRLDDLPTRQKDRIKLLHGSLMYRDKRISGFDAAAVVEVIEHLDPPRLSAFERVVFEFARPGTVVLTTPNREYNSMWPSLPARQFRHSDHRFEWSRAEFQDWACRIAEKYGYRVRFLPVGPEDANLGPPTQMGVYTKEVA